ncbi:hypothetical protein [Nocardioides coralli]|uniref:hypothetical protein n=1 Tax=Nocardioides coralli TaxID=2872154 RepID=UPI001CA43ED3|nr:hypothetical protein [Nocardioides coralli]QZY29581.1 hypothetical protein K6T13_02485 [Nocardioides coralli]
MSRPPSPEDRRDETAAQRRARLAAVFGEVLPETTSDERDTDASGERDTDEWLRGQVPPHHGS